MVYLNQKRQCFGSNDLIISFLSKILRGVMQLSKDILEMHGI